MKRKKIGTFPFVSVSFVKAKEKTYQYYYFRKEGSRVRLPGRPGDVAFHEKYTELLARKATVYPETRYGSIRWVIKAYKETPEWKKLSSSTKGNMLRYFDLIIADNGNKLASSLKPEKVWELRDSMQETPGKADNYIATLSTLMKYSIRKGLRTVNPCDKVARLSTGEHKPWPGHVLAKALEAANERLKLAIILHLYTGQRISDVVRMEWEHVNEGVLHVVQQKTKKELWVPLHKDLVEVLNKTPKTSKYILANQSGRLASTNSVRTRLRILMSEIKENYVFHGLRKNAVNALLEAGCNTWEVSSITGQAPQMVEHYAKEVNLLALARRAIQKWEVSKDLSKIDEGEI